MAASGNPFLNVEFSKFVFDAFMVPSLLTVLW